VIKTKEEQKQ